MTENNRPSQRSSQNASRRPAQRAPQRETSLPRQSARSSASRSGATAERYSRDAYSSRTSAGGRRTNAATSPSNRSSNNGSQGKRSTKKGGANPLFLLIAGLLIAGAIVALGFGVSSLLGSSSSSSSASASASESIEPAAPTSGTSEEGLPTTGGGKATAAGKTAVGIVRTAEERKATSDSANNETPGPKTVYLTFDDGPSTNTHNILKVLDEYGVKATWFVKGNQPQVEYVKDIWNAGNQIAIHTYNHDYTGVYASTDAYWNDLHAAGSVIEEYLGFEPTLVRFPGGSHNSYNAAVSDSIISTMSSDGYHYFDWNVSSGDGADHSAQFIIDYVLDQAEGCHSVCLLMHDSAAKDTTVEALPTIIEWFIDNDFEFDVLLANSYGYHF